MDDSDKLMALRVALDDLGSEISEDDSTLLSYLWQAQEAILNRLYPYMNDAEYENAVVPRRYESKQIRIAAYLLNKRGAEGETQHIENGIHRNYKSSDIPDEMLRDIPPLIGIPR